MTETDWQEAAVRMRREDKAATAEIAEAVGRSESQVRKVLAKANAERAINGAPSSNGDGPHDAIPGQTTVDDFTKTCEHGVPVDVDCEGCREEREVEAAWAGRDEFVAEAGEAVGPMPPTPVADYGDVPVEELRVDGTTQFALDLGGDVATEATVTFTGTFPSGFFRKGHVFGGSFEARIVGVGEKDKLDKASMTFRPGPQKFTALITDLRVE